MAAWSNSLSPEVKRIWDRVNKGDSNVQMVLMSEGNVIRVSPNDKEEKVIWTYGLGGCYACLVYVEDNDGNRRAVLTHYPPNEIRQNREQLQELIRSNVNFGEGKLQKASFVIMAPGRCVQDPSTQKIILTVQDQLIVDFLSSVFEREVGLYALVKDVRLELYSTTQEYGRKDGGVFLVYVPPVGRGIPRYRTWFSSGEL